MCNPETRNEERSEIGASQTGSKKQRLVEGVVFPFRPMGAKAIPVELINNGNVRGWANSGLATLSQTISTVLGESYDFSFFPSLMETSPPVYIAIKLAPEALARVEGAELEGAKM